MTIRMGGYLWQSIISRERRCNRKKLVVIVYL